MNILFITASRLGDAIISTAVIESIVKLYPQCHLTIAAGPIALPLFEDHPNVIRLLCMNKKKYNLHWYELWQEIKNEAWDIIVDCRNSLVSYGVKTKKRYIFRPSKQSIQLKHLQLCQWIMKSIPEINNINCLSPQLHIASERQKSLNIMLKSHKNIPIIAVAPKANWALKEWPESYFLDLIKKLTSENSLLPHAKIMVCASPAEHKQLGNFKKSLGTSYIDMPSDMHLLDTAAALKSCNLFVGNDSGLMHKAAALNVLTFGLFGPSKDHIYAPTGQKAFAIRTPESYEQLWAQVEKGANTTLMGSLTVDHVFNTIASVMHQEVKI